MIETLNGENGHSPASSRKAHRRRRTALCSTAAGHVASYLPQPGRQGSGRCRAVRRPGPDRGCFRRPDGLQPPTGKRCPRGLVACARGKRCRGSARPRSPRRPGPFGIRMISARSIGTAIFFDSARAKAPWWNCWTRPAEAASRASSKRRSWKGSAPRQRDCPALRPRRRCPRLGLADRAGRRAGQLPPRRPPHRCLHRYHGLTAGDGWENTRGPGQALQLAWAFSWQPGRLAHQKRRRTHGLPHRPGMEQRLQRHHDRQRRRPRWNGCGPCRAGMIATQASDEAKDVLAIARALGYRKGRRRRQ